MSRVAIRSILMGFLAAAAPACVTDEVAAPEQAGASELPPAGDDYDADLDLSLDDGWQRELDAGIGRVESAAERFIEASSELYDLLIAMEEGKAGVASPRVDAALRQSVQRHDELVVAVDRFRDRMGQEDARSALLARTGGAREYAHVETLLRGFRRASGQAVSYAAVRGRLVTGALALEGEGGAPSMAAVPSAQRDALALLDYLRRVSSEVASVSGTVTNWVSDARRGGHPQGLSVESLAH